jgi:hypothetical protein
MHLHDYKKRKEPARKSEHEKIEGGGSWREAKWSLVMCGDVSEWKKGNGSERMRKGKERIEGNARKQTEIEGKCRLRKKGTGRRKGQRGKNGIEGMGSEGKVKLLGTIGWASPARFQWFYMGYSNWTRHREVYPPYSPWTINQ